MAGMQGERFKEAQKNQFSDAEENNAAMNEAEVGCKGRHIEGRSGRVIPN